MPQVSIIIVCMNRPDNLYPCLESIRSTTKQVSYETLVVAYLYDKMALAKARKDFPGWNSSRAMKYAASPKTTISH